MPIIKDRTKLPDATEADLRETYEAMKGEPPPAASSAAALQVMTSMALLSNINAAGHLGVPAGGKAEPLTHQELDARRKARAGTSAGTGTNGIGGLNSRPRHWDHSMESSNMTSTKKTKPEATEAKAGRPKQPITVSATGNGTTNVRPASFRGQVLAAITAKKKISSTDLDAMFGRSTLGEIRTLEKLGHVATAA